MNKISLVVLASILATGCYASSTVNTPVGVKKNTMIAGGLVSISNTDTKTAFEQDCRQWLKPGLPADPVTGRPADMALPDREIYQTCFANHMQPVDPMGQQSAPIPVDVDGNGHADYFQYGGFFIPANVVNAYGIPGYGGVIPGMIGANYGYGPTGMYFPGAYNAADGSSLDPRMQVQVQATPTSQQTSGNPANPWNSKNPDDKPATTKQLKALASQIDRLSEQQAAGKK